MSFEVKFMFTDKDWKIILLIIELYKSRKNSQYPQPQYTQLNPLIT